MLASLSHDLRTPLAAIRGASETLRTAWDRLDATTRADLLSSIEEDTARMTRFLANILDMTRLESGEIAPRITRVDVAEVVGAALARVQGAVVLRDIPIDLPEVAADPALLEQVLVNVLDNAVKYSPADAARVVAAIRRGRDVEIRVTDSGPGIAVKDLPHVFDSFYRATRGDRTSTGTGLGLAIARGMMAAMGGNIEARSPRADAPADGTLAANGPGTDIILHLPVAP